MGLGGFPDVPLARARERAREERESIDKGNDPIQERRSRKLALAASQATSVTFAYCANAYIEANEVSWRNAKHVAQWRTSLERYAFSVIGELAVRDISISHVLLILEPIWRSKTETAARVRGRIEAVLDWATVRAYRSGDNPARWRGHLDKILPKPSKVKPVSHHEALPISQVGAFFAQLRAQAGLAARALEFAILTAARSGEVRGACWDEINLNDAVWTIPAARMKAGKEHRVPLSAAALALLRAMPRLGDSRLVFPSRKGTALSDMALTAVMRRMNLDAVPHGFRSTFRDWCAEHTNFPREVAEMSLAHAIGDKVEAAYRRGDLFAKRRELMDAWAAYCDANE